MCSRPIIKDGNTFACRTCDQCIATRRAGWIARAMAEKAEWPHTLCVALTYNNDTQENRDAAAMFNYGDVRAFLKRLLRASTYKKPGSRVRFICAGEQGDRYGRCHWHLILYSDLDLTQLGTVQLRGETITDRNDMFTVGKQKRRLDWSLWGKGFVTFQEPDQGGMAYVLSYCLKDQFTQQKSEGTMREAKSENFATGLFRMSKRPSIGESWLIRKLEGLEGSGSVLPSLQIKIPDMSGYWHPNGVFREKLLWGLVALNQRAVWSTGANAPQWAALLASCKDNPSDLEILNVTQKELDDETLDARIARTQREAAGEAITRETARRCGGQLPCTHCLAGLSDETLATLGVAATFNDWGDPTFEATRGLESVADRQATSGGGINPFCQNRGSAPQRRAFPRSSETVA